MACTTYKNDEKICSRELSYRLYLAYKKNAQLIKHYAIKTYGGVDV
jgi:hypothetical protein